MIEHIIAQCSEHIQNDLLCVLDGLDNDTLNNALDVIVDRMGILQTELESFIAARAAAEAED